MRQPRTYLKFRRILRGMRWNFFAAVNVTDVEFELEVPSAPLTLEQVWTNIVKVFPLSFNPSINGLHLLWVLDVRV